MPSFKQIFKVVNPGDDAQDSATDQADAQERIRNDVENNKVLIYMKGSPEAPQCGFSAATIDVFNQLGVPYATRDVLQDPEIRQGVKEFSNWPTVPQIYVDGKFIGGSDIVIDLHARGELGKIVQDALKE
ncbi:MAG: Grx4 family monothiol glutaredoxin [SAR324 cluster bacterium]|nr:Grx4 family monothiol glutaredoxin [SAR324 cluster bacterium]